MLHAACWKCRTQKDRQKIFHLGNITELCRAISSQLRHESTIGKNLLNSNVSPTWRHNMVNFGPQRLRSVGESGHTSTFQRVSRLGSVTARHSSSGRQPNFAALNRGRHLYSLGRPSRWALAHILVLFSVFFLLRFVMVMCSQLATGFSSAF